MSTEKFGFVYLWRDAKHNRYYVGCHWGTYDDGYVCSSSWMMIAYKRRPEDFKRRILKTNLTRQQMYDEETRYLRMIKPHEKKVRYYNLHIGDKKLWHQYPSQVRTIGQKISHAKMGKSPNWKNPTERGFNITNGKRRAFQKHLEETGSKFTPEHRAKISVAVTGREHTQEWKDHNSVLLNEQWSDGTRSRDKAAQRMKEKWANGDFSNRPRKVFKSYEVQFPDGHVETINDLVTFCKERSLTHSNMLASLRGRIKQHKGYKVLNLLNTS